MSRRIVLATRNAHKLEELRSILGPLLDGLELVADDGPEPIEDGATFIENSMIKAHAAAARSGLPALADDSGICVDALGGAPGIHSARFAGTRDDADNVTLLLQRLEGAADRSARFECAATLVVPGEPPVVVSELGVWPGRVALERVGAGGFGYDPVFVPDGLDVTSAELTAAEKNAISHRARAFRALMPRARELLLG